MGGNAKRVSTPPVIVQHDGQWWVEISLDGGQESILAPVGDGAFLYQQIVEKLVLPRMRGKADPVIEYHMTEMGVDAGGYYTKTKGVKTYDRVASPND